MIPVRDYNRTRTFPFVTLMLIAVNCVVFAQELRLASQKQIEAFVRGYGAIPYELTHNIDLDPQIILPVYFTLITSMYMHGGPMHLLGNMLYLWIFGNDMEDRFGHARFFAVYTLWGVFAAVAQSLVNINSKIPMIGASGAIAGVLGAYIVILPTAKIESVFIVVPVRLPALILIGQWIFFQFVDGDVFSWRQPDTGIAYLAHIGGVVLGILSGLIYRASRPHEFENEWHTW